ncbi:MAG: DUF6538 domain-containing protein [Thiotrichales bacterium]
MKHQTYLRRRGAVYYCRIRIPLDLQAHFDGRQEINLSLRTRDRRQAAKLCRSVVWRITQRFDELRFKALAGDA